eukprot:31454-Pelagococcus_subviridis.AAC.8
MNATRVKARDWKKTMKRVRERSIDPPTDLRAESARSRGLDRGPRPHPPSQDRARLLATQARLRGLVAVARPERRGRRAPPAAARLRTDGALRSKRAGSGPGAAVALVRALLRAVAYRALVSRERDRLVRRVRERILQRVPRRRRRVSPGFHRARRHLSTPARERDRRAGLFGAVRLLPERRRQRVRPRVRRAIALRRGRESMRLAERRARARATLGEDLRRVVQSVVRSDVGVESKGVRSGVERHRGVSGLKARDPVRREMTAGRESP